MEAQKALSDEFAAELQSLDIITFLECEEYCGIKLPIGQRCVLKAIYGLELTPDEFEHYKAMVSGAKWQDSDGTIYEPQFPREVSEQHNVGHESDEVVLVCGRRGGKSLSISTGMALYESICRAHIWKAHLMPGEQACAVIVATRQDQAKKIIQKQCANILMRSPRLKCLLDEEPKALEIALINGMVIMSLPCSSTAGRGLPVYFLCLDEAAHFRVEGVTTGDSVYDSIRPAMAQFPGAKVVFATSPAAKQGLVWDMFTQGFEVEGRTTIQAPTRLMNSFVSPDFIAKERRRDPDNTKREFDAWFVERMSAFFPLSLELCYVLDGDTAPTGKDIYYAAMDQSGLSGRDNYAFAIAHSDGGTTYIDTCRLWDSVNIKDIMDEIAALCEKYRIGMVQHDRYASGWVTNTLSDYGLTGEIAPAMPVIYTNTKHLIVAGRLQLPDLPELRNGMANTMAVYGKNNALSIYHERDSWGHADAADSAVRAIWQATQLSEETSDTVLVYDCASEIGNILQVTGW